MMTLKLLLLPPAVGLLPLGPISPSIPAWWCRADPALQEGGNIHPSAPRAVSLRDRRCWDLPELVNATKVPPVLEVAGLGSAGAGSPLLPQGTLDDLLALILFPSPCPRKPWDNGMHISASSSSRLSLTIGCLPQFDLRGL